MTPVEIYAINEIFGCRFPLPENYEYKGDILTEHCVRNLLLEIFVEVSLYFKIQNPLALPCITCMISMRIKVILRDSTGRIRIRIQLRLITSIK